MFSAVQLCEVVKRDCRMFSAVQLGEVGQERLQDVFLRAAG